MKPAPLQWLKWISTMQGIAQAGLHYAVDPFDQERYHQLSDVVAELAGHCSDHTTDEIKHIFSLEQGYATPKIGSRAFILKDDQVLLAKERSDGLWTLPGGFIDQNETSSESIIRETQEETGLTVSVLKLLAVWDTFHHNQPPQWPHVYNCFFHCEIQSGTATETLEIEAVDFFDINDLPPLSTPRVTLKQMQRLYALIKTPQPTQFD